MSETILDDDLKLTDLFHLEVLQELQDSFYNLTGCSMWISDAYGHEVTKPRSCHDFCNKFTKGSKVGSKRCRDCDMRASKISAERGEPIIYTCHNGLMDFCAPIMVEGKLLGCFLGGQVTEHILDMEKIREKASEFGIDPDEYVHASKRVPLMDRFHLAKLAKFFALISNMMSYMAYKRYYVQQKSEEVEREANMKSDFLANMSHEIRTPMNAVIGMAEMALREELPPAAREYINQIKTAGNSLLTIINDILDFSKIDSGKMDINMIQYEPLSLVHDITNIILTRIGDKNLEFLVDYDPNIPRQLMGDNARIKQIIVNLANNAVKFTKEGRVKVKISYTKNSEHEAMLKIEVMDSGIGIKQEDLGKLFQSFSQVDSKRNRNIEGTGLGLAISKQLVNLMNGKIWVESEYGKGSTFGFEIPQIMLSDEGSVKIKNQGEMRVGILIDNIFVKNQLRLDLERLGAQAVTVSQDGLKSGIYDLDYLFIDNPQFNEDIQVFVQRHQGIHCVLMTEFKAQVSYDYPNLTVIKKPIYTSNLGAILNNEELYQNPDESAEEDFDFIAPEAEILVVDDVILNLTVAEGLMKPLQMKIDTALSGREAIEKIQAKHYDIVFMDHMMPEMDGVETTHIIRESIQEYNNVPIIALTANVIEGMPSMFLVEGMNDYIAKPIELPVLLKKLRQWLPQDKILDVDPEEMAELAAKSNADGSGGRSLDMLRNTGELDINSALKLLGSESLLWDVLDDYYKVILKKADLMQEYYEAEDWPNYAIEVHALKSASRQIGAIELSETAEKLEAAAKDADVATIVSNHDAMLTRYRYYEKVLHPFMKETVETAGTEEIDADSLRDLFGQLREMIDELDMDGMEEIAGQMARYSYPPEQLEIFKQVRECVETLDVDTCTELLDEWEKLL